MTVAIAINAAMSALAFVFTLRLIPSVRDMFIKANLFGVDLNKKRKEKV
jgi:UDP-N-acetylglucosamine--dolichyl-phosphate N-acetylglucosaminephosphotransferase